MNGQKLKALIDSAGPGKIATIPALLKIINQDDNNVETFNNVAGHKGYSIRFNCKGKAFIITEKSTVLLDTKPGG